MSETRSPEEDFGIKALDRRIAFHKDLQILEIDLGALHIANSANANALYDRLEARIAETGEPLWFFLINYRGTRIDPESWVAWSRRGRDLNLAHSMATVRYDASPETRSQIERAAGTDYFDPNLFASRDDAIERLKSLPSRRVTRIVHEPTLERSEYYKRVKVNSNEQIADFDFRNIVFNHSRDVNDCYDVLEEVIGSTGRKWYFLVNYEGCRIMSSAWVEYAARGKRLNERWSLGSVRYAPDSETDTDIRLRAETGGFRPNIRNTREEALELIREMKARSR